MSSDAQDKIETSYEAFVRGDDLPVSMIALVAYWEGYRLGYGVEDMERLDYQTVDTQFGRWWEANAP